MSERPDARGENTEDGEILADLFDTLLQEILDGRTPDLASFLPDRPDLRDRIAKTWALACSVAGRREPGRPVLGGYEIERELGHGGMGTVYLARHQALDRQVAIKVLPHSLAMSPRAKQRFLEEARALARLRHDHVVHIHRIIDHEEMLAFEMEYVDGGSLRSLIVDLAQKSKPQTIQCLAEALKVPPDSLGTRNTVEWFVRLGIRVARALGEVHRHGLIHRDVKPSNILLRANGQPVLADFGLAREGDMHATKAAFAGTPVYAAPERLRSGDADVDARADVYSLGVTLYEAFTLGPSFGGNSTHEVLRRIEEGNLPSLRKRAPNVSRDLETVIAKAMEPDRRHRYASADEFADDLERLLSLQPIHARPAGPVRRAAKFLRRHQKLAIAAAAGAVLLAAVAWPVAAHAQSVELAHQRAATALLDARSRLLCPENLGFSSWATERDASRQRARRTSAAKAAQLARLDGAIASYDAALAETPSDTVQIERDVIALVRTLVDHDDRGDGEVGGAPTERLPTLTSVLARRAMTHQELGSNLERTIAEATAQDRFVAGLLAFLRNDPGTCRRCWQGLEDTGNDRLFVDACLALQMANDGQPERAYPRLFRAARALPKATALSFAIAEAAVASGDVDLAEDWLRSTPTSNGSPEQPRRVLLQADVLAAKGDIAGARRLFGKLTTIDPSSPEPLQRLASLAMAEGDQTSAARLYVDMARRWPDLVQPRVQVARMALQRRDLNAYLHEARRVLGGDLRRYSASAARQLAGILRLGGLRDLYAEATASLDADQASWRDADVLPLSAWVQPSRLRGLEQSLRFWATFDRATEACSPNEIRPVALALQGTWHTLVGLPGLTLTLPWQLQVAGLAGIPLMKERATQFASPLLLPFQRILGDRLHTFDMARVVTKTSAEWKQLYAQQVLRVGDVNGDTLPDLCIAAPPMGVDNGDGYVEFRSIGDGALLGSWTSDDEGTAFARAIADLGDVDGDLCNDIAVGAPINSRWSASAATVTLRSGRTGKTIWTIEGDTASFGCALASLGDVDGDGVRDLIVGQPTMNLSPDGRGVAFVCSGRTGDRLHHLVAGRGGVWFGGAVAGAGDGNGDGFEDVLVGGNFGQAPGLVALFDGRTGALLNTFAEDDEETDFGRCIAGLRDIDGDGLADIVIGAPAMSGGGRQPSKVHVISSRTGKVVYEQRGERNGDGFGTTICTLPDWRHPGEAAIAASSHHGGPVGNGYVRVFAAVNGTPFQTFAGGGRGRFGYSLVDLGDRDRDGLRDLGVTTLSIDSAALISLSYADYLRNKDDK